MTDLAASLRRLRKAAKRLAAAEDERGAAMRDRDEALREARDAGASYDVLQEAAGVSRMTVASKVKRP